MMINVKKLWNGFASVRSLTIKRVVDKRENLKIEYRGKVMTVPFDRLMHPLQLHSREMKSKFTGQPYTLFDFKFIPDGEKVVIPNDDEHGELEAQRLFKI